MKTVLVYYLNLNKQTEFYKILKHDTFLVEGHVNQFNHQILAIYYISNNKIMTRKEYLKSVEKRHDEYLKENKIDGFNNLQQFIDFLESLKE